MSAIRENYLTLSAMLRAREVRQLTYLKAVAMADASGMEETAKQLAECGFEDMSRMGASEIGEALAARRAEILSELDRLTPDKELLDLFRIKYDYHNAKTLIKAEAAGSAPEKLLSEAGRFRAERLLSDYREESMGDYPKLFSSAIAEAKELLARSSNPQLSDFVLDRAYFAELTLLAESLGSEYISGYVKMLVDCANLRTAVRVLRMGKSADILHDALVAGGNVKCERLESASSPAEIAELFLSGPLSSAASLVEAAVESAGMTAFEKACDDAVTAYVKRAKYVTYGPEVVAAYLASLEIETSAVRMLLTGKLSGVAPEVIKERLRDMYA